MITKFKLFEVIGFFVYAINSGDGLEKDTKYQVTKITLEWDDNIYYELEEIPGREFRKDKFIYETEYVANKFNI